ncbi:universal stress protein [Sulfuricystis multivorans]|uniref:universal stress protein n=1 Tax=Sulfuricystis multivorans TaxID=2211108 RepID=UPI000F82F49F|nr:universal stress protein [Sulfuricystis multivorans]
MANWLVPVDGDAISLKPIDWIISHRDEWKTLPTIHLLNVQPPLTGDVGRFVNAEQIRDFHREEGLKALAEAKGRLEAAGIVPRLHVSVGSSAEIIIAYAKDIGSEMILLGTRGHTGIGGTLLGSVASRVVAHAPVPVLLIR